ncbi:MAG: TPR end-of-group domain-containing protein, partial [Pyrinomonadaceae bacterium]
ERADERSDIFSTGVLVYEMVTGIWAFQGKTVIDVRHQVLYGTPKPIAEMRRDAVPARLQAIVDKALAKEPKDRYQKISQMRDDLRAVLQEVAGAPLMAGDTYRPSHVDSGMFKRMKNWFTGKSTPESSSSASHPSASNPPSFIPEFNLTATSTGAEKKTVAILPFKNLSGEESSNFLEFALADSVITELAQLRSLIVRPSSVIAKYQGNEIDPREAGKELRAHAVLSAGFMRGGDKMRVNAQLLDVVSGDILWSDRIDADGNDILTLQDGIAQRILEGLRLELSDNEQEKLGRRMTENHDAWEEYLRGRDNFGRFIFRTLDPNDCEAAIQNFKNAVELDSHFALAYSGLGACYANRVFKGMGDPEDYTLAETAFTKAFFYDPNVVEARVLMVMIYMARGEKKKARAEIELLEKQFPNEAPLFFVKGVVNRLDGNYDVSLKAFERLVRLDPAARAVAAYNRARIFIYKQEYDQAIVELEKGEKVEPDHPMLKIFRSGAYYYRGDKEAAIELMRKVVDEHPEMDGIRPLFALYLAGGGYKDEALAQLDEDALSISKADHDMAYWVASTYSILGEKELAFKWLNKAIKLGNQNLPHFQKDKSLDPLRDDPRFAEIMAKASNGD